MPPKKPVTMLAMPWPWLSVCLSLWVSVISSTTAAVSSDSSRPTMAIATETGAMMRNVATVNGTWGTWKKGSVEGRGPMSPTCVVAMPVSIVNAVSVTIATSGEGTALVSRGRP
jgi:hypothetical protein